MEVKLSEIPTKAQADEAFSDWDSHTAECAWCSGHRNDPPTCPVVLECEAIVMAQMNKLTLADQRAPFEKIARVYSGKPGCGCGCRGTYWEDARNIKRVVDVMNKRQAEVTFEYEVYAIEDDKRYYWAYTIEFDKGG